MLEITPISGVLRVFGVEHRDVELRGAERVGPVLFVLGDRGVKGT